MRRNKKEKRRFQERALWQKLLLVTGWSLSAAAALFLCMILFLTVTEYRPEEKEALAVKTAAQEAALQKGDALKVMTWNIGYGALDERADFFMDGGKKVMTADEKAVRKNLDAVNTELAEEKADIVLLQEVDRDSTRSHGIDEAARITKECSEYHMTFANNFKVAWIPYPFPMLGKVDSGIETLSRYKISEAERVKLPNPFSWPMRMANLKRCLAIHRIPIQDSDKELVVVNLHLEAYDSGEGKAAQTKVLRKYLEAERRKGNYVVAGGDFNQVFSTVDTTAYPVYRGRWQPGVIEESAFQGGLSLLMDSSAPTCRSLDQPLKGKDRKAFQFYMIDGFIVSDNLAVQKLETKDLGFVHSDHNPVRLEVVLK